LYQWILIFSHEIRNKFFKTINFSITYIVDLMVEMIMKMYRRGFLIRNGDD